jgi:rubrerythrin
MPIETPQDLREHIELAIKVELATIPPYLFAMYSIEDQGSQAALLIRSIVVEEMLHTALASNLLLAVGGNPQFETTALMPTYPGLLPHHVPPLELGLAPASPNLIREVFMRIEQPEAHGAPSEPDAFETLGQFYHALENGIIDLGERFDLFKDPQANRQLSDPTFYTPVALDAEDSGGLMLVDSAESAEAAIEVIVHQGEGLSTERWADPAHQELTHYSKLLEISKGVSPLGSVRAVRRGPRTADFPEALRPVSVIFNASYRYLFFVLADLFGPLTDKGAAVGRMYRLMANLMSELALYLVRQPIGRGELAGPTFEIFEFDTGDRDVELANLAKQVVELHPDLAHIVETIAALQR